ncbi:MAG: ABC transporter permease [Sutterellaceae bacterium]|nr:ABC transporter permease [Burkholderiaceae bacterium]MCX7901647.1 ABC transporter permease [Burkholderiaceae bacterium]MDW8430028.1 ABC transporter permease [Sutterellaceae bacterium]
MSLLRLAWAQLAFRPLQTLLAGLLLAAAVTTLLLLLQLRTQLTAQLLRDVTGIDLIVGAKGSPLQLILSAVYHVDVPTGNVAADTVARLRANPLVAKAIAVALGDNVRGFRIVGTEPALAEHYGARLSRGRFWQAPMEAVLGATAARVTGLAVGARFRSVHGLAAGGPEHEEAEYTVVGVLAPTGTVLDRLVLTDLQSVWLVHEGQPADAAEAAALAAERQVTAVLVSYASPLAAAVLPRQVNAEPHWMAAAPATELARLLGVFGVAFDVVRAFAMVLFAGAALAMFVALTQGFEERRYDFAVLRLCGAGPWRLAALMLLQGWLLAALAFVTGAAGAAVALAAIADWLAQTRSLPLAGLRPDAGFAAVGALTLAIATLSVGWPAWRAAHVDLHRTLARD